jgi:RHS repeat-associated protein
VNTIGSLAITDTFSYDSLNRLKSTVETTTSGTGWTENNSYDRYGNRGGGSLSLTFSTSPSNNRISNGGYSYDAVGNLQNDGVHAYTFDAENKSSKVDTVLAYVYDGAGQRVRKLVGENLRFIYGIGGGVVAEFSGSSGALQKEYVRGAGGMATIEPTAVNGNGTRYATSDHLGTPRVVTNSIAAVVSRHDYKPFGEEIAAGVAGRTTGMGYSVTDNVRQKFTSKERDNETGLDYFNARYYASAQGRFTSIDPLIASGRVGNPQSWNRYVYVLNNPVRLIDPNGLRDDDPQKQPLPPSPAPLPPVIPPVSSDFEGSPDYVQKKALAPKPNVNVTPGTPESAGNLALPNGQFVTGVVSIFTVQITNEAGQPIPGLDVKESNETRNDTNGLTTIENPNAVQTDATGSFLDLVSGNNVQSNSQLSPANVRRATFDQIESSTSVTTRQTLTISAPGYGVLGTAVYERTFSNMDGSNRRPAINPATGRHFNNFQVTATPVTMSYP